MDSLFVSVLLVTWNRKNDILETIRSIYAQDYPHFEIVVVDNGSIDGTVESLRQEFPDIKSIALDKNVGISMGRNVGIAAAKGDIIFCLDSDASPAPDAISNLVKKFDAAPDIGVINSKIVNAYSKVMDGGPGWVYSEKQKEKQDTEFLSWNFSEGGAAIRKQVIDQVGPFWDRLFFGCEGQELALRVWDAGYKILYYPSSIVYHRASEQQRVANKERDYLFFRNTLYIYIARYPWWMFMLLTPLKIGAVFIRFAKRKYLSLAFKALREVWDGLPLLLKERKPIKNDTARMYLKLLTEQGPLSWNLVSWFKYKA